MSAIRDFFMKRKTDKKFKKAGSGHRLSDDTRPQQPPPTKGVPSKAPARGGPSEGAQRAGAAALARFEQNKNATNPNWSLQAIRAQAMKELQLEQQTKDNAEREVKTVVHEAPAQLGVEGVFFKCPLIGPDILSYHELMKRIKEFLYMQLEEERGLAASLIVHTCNPSKERVQQCVDTLCKYLTNIVDNPYEDKYRRIRCNNKVFKEKVQPMMGAEEFLVAAGFSKENLSIDGAPEEDFYVLPMDADLEMLPALLDALRTAEPIRPELDRNLRVFLPSQTTPSIRLPDDFFNLTAEDVIREHTERQREVRLNDELRTRAMRERDAKREALFYRFTLIRIRMPTGILIQGTFGTGETLQDVMEFLDEQLVDREKPHVLKTSTGETLTELGSTLVELHLYPAVILNAVWEPPLRDTDYLLPEVLALVQPI